MPTKQKPAPATPVTPSIQIERCDRFYDPRDQTQWTVFQAHKGRKHVVLQGTGATRGQTRQVLREDMTAYLKAQVPTTVKRGQTVYCGDDRCVVDDFSEGGRFIHLWGPFGDDEGHEHENMVPSFGASAYGLRLPFPSEEKMVFSAKSSEEIHEQRLKLEGVRKTIPNKIPGLPDEIHACIDAQIDALLNRLTSDQVFETRKDWQQTGIARLVAARWMEGVSPIPPLHRWTEIAKHRID